MNELIHIPFRDREVLAVEDENKPFIVLKPALEHIGLDYKNQHEKLRTKSWACMVLRTMQLPGDSQRREHATVDLRTFLMLLATIDERRVHEAARPALIAYQNEVADVIEAYYAKGHVLNPRRKRIDLSMVTLSFDEATALIHQEYGEDIPVTYFTRILRAAGILRQAGCVPHKTERRYFFFTGTAWEIRAWALPHLLRTFRETVREFQRYPFEQLRLDLASVDRLSLGGAS
ncbi:phage antirepressor N-terminal domain-containing protein [Streptosporangium sp. G12]